MTPPPIIRGRQADDALKVTHDRKVSPRGTWQESRSRWVPSVGNSFGLPAGDSCPGKTPFCESCYAVGSEQAAGVRDLVRHNFRMLQAAGTVDAMASLLDEMICRCVAQFDHLQLSGRERIFRIHWDGDFFSVDYAQAWRQVIAAHPDVQFWAYTRSFAPPVDVVGILAPLANLALYLSADKHNLAAAQCAVGTHPRVRLALCAVDYNTANAMVAAAENPRLPTAIVCPENNGRVPLMTDGVGACVTCAVCTVGRRDVVFSTSHREDVTAWQPRKLRGRRMGMAATRDRIRSWLRDHGPVDDEHGRAIHVLAEKVACSYQSTWQACKALEADGVITRRTRGRNTVTITLAVSPTVAAPPAPAQDTDPGFTPDCDFCRRAAPKACLMHMEPAAVRVQIMGSGNGNGTASHAVESPAEDDVPGLLHPSVGRVDVTDPGVRWVLQHAAEEHDLLVDYMARYAEQVDETARYKQALIDARELIGNLRAQRDRLLGKEPIP